MDIRPESYEDARIIFELAYRIFTIFDILLLTIHKYGCHRMCLVTVINAKAYRLSFVCLYCFGRISRSFERIRVCRFSVLSFYYISRCPASVCRKAELNCLILFGLDSYIEIFRDVRYIHIVIRVLLFTVDYPFIDDPAPFDLGLYIDLSSALDAVYGDAAVSLSRACCITVDFEREADMICRRCHCVLALDS